MRSTSSSLIFENSTRNKKLSVRLSESITLFSFIAPLGSVWAFLLFFLIQIAQLPNFFDSFFSLTPLLRLAHTKIQQTENEIMIMTLHCTSDASQKTCRAISLARSSFGIILSTFKSNQKEMTIRNHAMHSNKKIWLKFTIFSFQLFFFENSLPRDRTTEWYWEGF